MFLRSLQNAALRSPDSDGSGGDDTRSTSSSNGYSREFVSDLRSEAKSWRQKANEFEKQFDIAKADAAKAANDLRTATEAHHKALGDAVKEAGVSAKAEAEAALAKVREDADLATKNASTAFSDRLIRAEVRAGAIAAGIGHQDYVSLLDTSAIKVDDKGDVVVPASFWADAKAAKAHLFTRTGAEAGKTTSTSPTPAAADAGAKKHVSQMTADEIRAARARISQGKPGIE
jgi:hypothetical protein